jgi:hypothetical protein
VDTWVSGISNEVFPQALPLLRRTFAEFSAAERRQIGERIKAGVNIDSIATDPDDAALDTEQAARVLPLLARLLGLNLEVCV